MGFFDSIKGVWNKAKNWMTDKGVGNTVGQILKGLGSTVGQIMVDKYPILEMLRPLAEKGADWLSKQYEQPQRRLNNPNNDQIRAFEPKPSKKLKTDIMQKQNENEIGFEE